MTLVRKTLIGITIAINLLVASATIFAAYSGHISPYSIEVAPIACMLFPLGLIASLAMIPLSSFVRRWITLIPLSTLVVCISPALNLCPLNILTVNDHAKGNSHAFTLMSYNAYNFKALDKEYPTDSTNATLSYIIATDADIVCLQECEYLSPLRAWHVFRPQVDSLKQQYPHRIIGGDNGESILSKYPVEKKSSAGYYSHFVVNTTKNKIDIINVHLRSMRLSEDEKKEYTELGNDGSKWRNIAVKVSRAAKNRARQALKLKQYIDSIDSDNIIVCGDFNDVPNCYAINTMCEDFDDAYTDCGFGPMITYHGNKIYFRIDHILYDGDFETTSFTRGDIDRSDHYPLIATFHWDKDTD